VRLLLEFAWLVGIIYSTIPLFWLLVHPFADFWRRQRSPFRVLLPAWVLLWIAVGVITWPWHFVRLYVAFWPWIAAAIFFLAGISVYRRVRTDLGAHILLGLPELRPQEHEQKLVTTGIYARVRHPIYLAHFCMLLAWTVGSGLLVNYCLLASAVVTGTAMIALEERELEKRFGEQFRKYRARVPILWPREHQIQESIFLQGDTIVWEFIIDGDKKNSWTIACDQLACLGEYTINQWPGADYFLIFVTRDGQYHQASFYAQGRDELLADLEEKLKSKLRLGLCNSTHWASRIIWPPEFENKEFYELSADVKTRVSPQVMALTQQGSNIRSNPTGHLQ
jgi:protein-S-isoprenylcysteine O-methyltransferase Ste14